MVISSATQSAQAFDAYARTASRPLEERQAERMVREAKAATETARVRKTTIGFSLGKFGIDFTSHDVELDTESLAQTAGSGQQTARQPSTQAFSSHLEAAEILATAEDTTASAKRTSGEPDTSALTRRKALEAYAEASLNLDVNVPGRLGSI